MLKLIEPSLFGAFLTAGFVILGCAASAAQIPAPDDVSGPPANAESSDTGLQWTVLQEGSGDEHPSATDNVTVHYTGWLTDGQMFDSSVSRGQPATFPLNRVIRGWTEGVQLMVVGEKRRFWIPSDLGYGERGGGGGRIPPGATLVFDVELLGIN